MIEEKFVTWRGQIESEMEGKNLPSEKWKSPTDLKGWGARYKVRVIGRDSAGKEVQTEQLDDATVLYPVTAGSGHQGSYQTSNLREGAFVWGFYDDPIAKTGLVIVGTFANNDQTKLQQKVPENGFDPYSTYMSQGVSVLDIATSVGEVSESNTKQVKTSSSDVKQQEKGKEETGLPVSVECDKIQLTQIQIEIKKFIQDIERFKNQVSSWESQILNPTISEEGKEYTLQEYIRYKIKNISKFIAQGIKTIITETEKYVQKKLNLATVDATAVVPPDIRDTSAKSVLETAKDAIACLFKKIIANLFNIIEDFLLQIAERFINTPLCAVENILGSLIGKLTGLISSAIQIALAPVNAIIGAVDIAGDIVDFVTDLISFLQCEETPDCPQITAWSVWEGATKFNVGSDITGLIDKVKTYASNVQQSIDPDNFNFDFDFGDIFENTCNVGPIFCGPPTVEFYGGGGSGAAGNVIISATGDILGVDLTSFGSGYQSAPAVRFVDSCGIGKGASGRTILGPVTATNSSGITTTTTGIVKVLIDNPGFGYLPTPNGDRGGDNRVWAKAGQTTVKRNDGIYDRPYNPGETIKINPGDEIYSCGSTRTSVQSETITAPQCETISLPQKEDPFLDNGTYPVTLELEDIIIDIAGANYNCAKDKIVIIPNNGVEVQYYCDRSGSLTNVKVIKTGIGFTEIPNIFVESETGFNAVLKPVLKVNKDGFGINVPVISVVDCVGKF